MTLDETAVFMGILQEAYPRFYAGKNENELRVSIMLWDEFLSDVSLDIALPALKRYIAISTWPPAISEIRKAIAEIRYPSMPDAGEAWQEVCHAISRFGYYRTEEAYESMEERTRLAVQRIGGMRTLCISENDVADRSKFFETYKNITEQEQTERLIPAKLQEAIAVIKSVPAMITNIQDPQPS